MLGSPLRRPAPAVADCGAEAGGEAGTPAGSPPKRAGATPRRSPSRSMLQALLPQPPAVVGRTYDAVLDTASQYLPATLSGTLPRRRSAPPPPPLRLAVQLLGGGEAALLLAPNATLAQLQQECAAAAGVPPQRQLLCVQEERPQGGLVGLLKSTATTLSSREAATRSFVDWANFLFVPEGVARELRGRGALAALRGSLAAVMAERDPSTAQVVVLLLDGRRTLLSVPLESSLEQLRQYVAQQAGVPPEQQRLSLAEQPPRGRGGRLAKALLRLLLALAAAGLAALLVCARWAVPGLAGGAPLTLQLVTESGREVQLDVSRQTTLEQLQQQAQEQHGESLNLQQLLLSSSPPRRPARPGGGGTS